MQNKKHTARRNFVIYLKSVVITILAMILVVIGYFAAGFLFGVN